MDSLIENLRVIVGRHNVLSEPDELIVYECDGLPQHKYRPRAVVFPSSTEQTSEVMRELARSEVPFTPRGAGTGLSGGALALNSGVVIEMARMRNILKIDVPNRTARVQTGVVNSHVSRAAAPFGLHYVPDPSSQPTCTIGGNIAENAGGIHCLKYGTTTDHVLATRVVLGGGEIVDLGGNGTEQRGYDLLGVFIGSEGTFGIATEATLRLVPIPPAVRTLLAEFPQVNDASHAVSAIIAAGVLPAALEMMDREIIRAVEASVFAAGLPIDAGAALLIELDGLEAGIDDEAEHVRSICMQHGARDCRMARDETERKKLWAARKGAFGAVGRISPDSMIQDAVVPRSRLPEVLDDAYHIASKYRLRIANVFHAGDGNLHPLICFDSRSPDEVHRVKEAGRALMETCVRAGGTITGEHGVGFDKRELLSLVFSEGDMDAMLRVRAAFDPTGLCNPGKIIPMLRGCGEARAIAVDLPIIRTADPTVSTVAAIRPTVAVSNARTSLTLDDAMGRLSELIGASNLSADSNLSTIVALPGSIEEVCQVMKLASSKGWTVVPAGAMSWLHSESLSRVNIVLSTRRLDHIIHHEPADLIAIAEAGVPLQQLNHELAQRGQWLAIDPPDDEAGSATIGGVVAGGAGGAQQFGYGAPRRHVIGMKVVLADGSLIKMGGRVVKNVAGYDLCKLFTGSRGTLGIIVEINFKLRPLPFESTTIGVSGARDSLLAFGRQVISFPLFPVAAELLSAGLAKQLRLSDADADLLLIKFDGSQKAVTEQTRRTLELMSGYPQLTAEVDRHPTIWRAVAAASSRCRQGLIWRLSVLPNDLGAILSSLPEGKSNVFWHVGVGDGRIRVMSELGDEETGSDPSLSYFEKIRAEARSYGASIILESAPSKLSKTMQTMDSLGPSADLTQRIKRQLDPGAILSPAYFGLNRH